MNVLRVGFATTILLTAGVAHAQNPREFRALSQVGTVGDELFGANPPYTAIVDNRDVCTPFAHISFVTTTVDNGTGSMHITSDI